MQTMTHKGFAQLDFILTERCNLHQVLDAFSNRNIALQSHHFILCAHVQFDIPRFEKKARKQARKFNLIENASKQNIIARDFVHYFHHKMNSSSDTAIEDHIEKKCAAINYALHEATRKQEESKKTVYSALPMDIRIYPAAN